MPKIRYKVTLDSEERVMLKEIATHGRHSSQKVLNALILLNCDQGRFQEQRLPNQQIADALPVSMKKIDRVKKRFVEQGLKLRWTNARPRGPTSERRTGTSRRISSH